MLRAEIRDQRSIRHERDVLYGGLSLRDVREQMLKDNDITQTQFRDLELNDGRLEDGMDVLSLFFTTDTYTKNLLGSIDPFGDVTTEAIDNRLKFIYQQLQDASWASQRTKIKQAIAALETLRDKIDPPIIIEEPKSPGPEPKLTEADRERSRNEDDYRSESAAQVIEDL